MSDTVIIAVISLVGTLGGSVIGAIYSSKLTAYRIEQLEKKVDKHNNLIDRMYKVEGKVDVIETKISNIKEDLK